MNIINKKSSILTVCGLLMCMTGMAQDIPEVPIPADSCENINMGLYSSPKMAITGSVATIEGQSLMKPVSNLSLSLVGRFTGLNTLEYSSEFANAGISKIIRGFSTTNGSAPLLIVDGGISTLSLLDYMNPEEIESISVLKDGSSLAVYGIRGSNGAIIVTTKRGVAGPLKVNTWYHYSIQQMTKKPPFVSSAEYAKLRNEAGFNDGLGTYSQFTQNEIDKFEAGTDPLYPTNNWYDMFVSKINTMQQAGLSVQGGNDRIKHFSTMNYLHQSSPFKYDDQPVRRGERSYDPTLKVDMANIRSNFDVKLNPYLSAFLLLNGTIRVDKTNQTSASSTYGQIMITPPTMYGPLTPVETVSADGEISAQSDNVTTVEGQDYPVYGILNRSGYRRVLYSWLNTQTGVNLDLGFLTDGISLSGLMAYQMYGINLTSTYRNYERYIRSNDLSRLDFTKYGTSENTPLAFAKQFSFNYNLNLSVRADYGRIFGDHTIQASIFYYYSKREIQPYLTSVDVLVSDLSILPYMTEIFGVTAMYGYRDKYFVKADLGYSGSEQFHPDYRFATTPAISAAWIASKEDILSGIDWLNMLKLRISYGVNANDQLGDERFLYADNISSYGVEELRGNPKLSAEKIRKQNYGIDLGLFGSVSLSVDYFYHHCDNMLVSSGLIPVFQTIPLYYFPKLNNGEMENRGVEITAGFNDRLTQDISVFANASFSFARNKVIKINELPYKERFYPNKTEGFRLGQPWGYLIDYSNGNGMFNSQQELDANLLTYSSIMAPRVGDFIYQDLNGEGIIDEGDLAPIGDPRYAEIYYSFNAGVQWKNFDFSFLLQGTANSSVVIGGTGAYEYSSRGVFNDIHKNAWTAERYAASEKIGYPALSLSGSANHVANSFFIMNSSYLKLRNVEIGYSMPASIAQILKMQNIRFSLSGQNLLTFDKMGSKYIDPETGSMAAFQPYRVYSIGVKCTF